jgi:hypothetical protein
MTRYFSHVRTKQGAPIRDRIGIEFRTLAAAQADAENAVQQTIAEKAAAGEDVEFSALEITNRARRTLAVVPFVDAASGPADQTKQ